MACDWQCGVELRPTTQQEDSLLAEEGRLFATPLLANSEDWPLTGARPRAHAREPADLETFERESTTSTDLAIEERGSRPQSHDREPADLEIDMDRAAAEAFLAPFVIERENLLPANRHPMVMAEAAAQDDIIDPSQLPTLAMRLLGRTFPEQVEVWPAAATTLVWRLQHLAVSILAVLAFGFVVVLAAFVRGLEAWSASAGQPCKPPLRWWLIGHIIILALGIMGCCSGMAFLGLAGWIAWGTALLQRRQTKKCPVELVQAVQEATSVELALFGLVLLVACLAGFAARVVRKIHSTCHGLDDPWEPETHLVFEAPTPVDLESNDGNAEEGTERTSLGPDGLELSSYDRECVICCDALAGIEVIARAACGHRFHKDCILEWLRNHRTCPLCRHRIDKPLGWAQRGPWRRDELVYRATETSQDQDGVDPAE